MRLRFKTQYSGLDTEQRIAYETVSDEKVLAFYKSLTYCYELKLIGFVPCEYLEPADENDLSAIDILIEAQK